MGKIFFFKISYSEFYPDAHGNGLYRRLIYKDMVFYTDKRLYTNPDLLHFLHKDGYLYLATHRLANGHYWVHWLADDKGNVLNPQICNINKYKVLITTMLSLILGSSSITYLLSHFDLSAYYSLCLLFMFILCIMVFLWFLDDTLAVIHPASRVILNGLADIKNEIYSRFTPPPTTPYIDNKKVTLPLTEEAHFISGVVLSPEMKTWSINANKTTKYYTGIQFKCNNENLYACWGKGNSNFNRQRTIYMRYHPPFIAENDSVHCIIWKSVNKTDSKVMRVKKMYNLTDGSLYPSSALVNHLYYQAPGEKHRFDNV